MADNTPLLRLPVEVHLEICSWLLICSEPAPTLPETAESWQSIWGNFYALGNLALASKYLYKATYPVLYQRINVPIHPSAVLIKLLRHLSQSADLARHVKEISFFVYLYQYSNPERLTTSQARFLLEHARRLRLNVPLDDRVLFHRPLVSLNRNLSYDKINEVSLDKFLEIPEASSFVSLMIALLLSQAPHLREMTMVGVQRTSLMDRDWYSERNKEELIDYPNDELLDFARWLPPTPPLQFPSLHRVDIETPPFKIGTHHTSIATFLSHTPSLTRLRISVGNYARDPQHIVPLLPRSFPHLTHLHLPDARIETLAHLA